MTAMKGTRATGRRLEGRSEVGGSVAVRLLSALIREPGGGEELSNAALRPAVGELGEHVAQVLERRRVDQVAADDEGLQNGQPPAAVVTTGKEKIFTAQSGPALLLLDVDVGQRDTRV